MATLVRETTSKDARGFKTTEQVYEDFAPITPTNGARTYSLTVADGKYQLTQTFTDEIPDPGGGGGQVFPETLSIEVSTSAEPIETHPIFSNLTDKNFNDIRIWKNDPNSPLLNGWTPAQSGTQGLIYERLINKSVSTFLSPRVVVKRTQVYTGIPSLAAVGKINDPGVDVNFGDINFILTGCTAVQEGSYYKVSYEWLGSAPGGWIPVLYGTQSS